MKSSVSPYSIAITAISVMLFVLAGWLMLSDSDASDSHHDEDAHHDHEEEMARGPHGGRLLIDHDFSLEISIYETGLPLNFVFMRTKITRALRLTKLRLISS